jgi:hypothetical protein
MNENRVRFPIATLKRDGKAIIEAAEAHAELKPRLVNDHLNQARVLLDKVNVISADQKGKRAEVGTLTKAQKTQLKALEIWMSRARYTAGLAYRGQSVKLHEEFQVGVNEPHDLGSIVHRADIILGAINKPDNAAAFLEKGWLDSDIKTFAAVRATLGTVDGTKQKGKGGAKKATTQRDRDAYALYEALLTIQNAAGLQWPEEDPANIAVRDEFRLNTFPPRAGSAAPEPESTPAPAAPVATA